MASLPALVTSLLLATVSVSAETGLVALEAHEEPVGRVLAELREVTGLNLMYDAGLDARVSVEVAGVTPTAAVRTLAAAAGLEVLEREGVLLVRKPRPRPPAPDVGSADGAFVSPSLDYPVRVLGTSPADLTLTASLRGFESRPGFSLVVAPQLKQIVLREYLEGRPIFGEMVRLSGLQAPLSGEVGIRNIRIYIDTAHSRYVAEILFSGLGQEVVHLVFRLRPSSLSVEVLFIFKTPR